MTEDNYKIVLSVFNCELNRTKSVRRAFIALSDEGREILLKNGFQLKSVNIEGFALKRTQYFKEVMMLTERIAHRIPGIEKRGFNNYHIDHIVSIKYGYKNGIPPEKIASLENLRMLPYIENMRKGAKVAVNHL